MALYHSTVSMSCLHYACYLKIKNPPPLQNMHVLSVHDTGHNLCPIVLTQCEVKLGGTLFILTFIV